VAIAQVLQVHPDARIIVLTTFDGDEDVHRAVQAGARGYLPKKVPGEELLKAIRGVHGGQRYVPEDIGGRLGDLLHRTVDP
jgi:two-component system NarL family response regulator